MRSEQAAHAAPPAAAKKANPPPFPNVPGHDRLSDNDRAGIAKAAWEFVEGTSREPAGDIEAFNLLVAGHVAGEVDIFRMPPNWLKPAAG